MRNSTARGDTLTGYSRWPGLGWTYVLHLHGLRPSSNPIRGFHTGRSPNLYLFTAGCSTALPVLATQSHIKHQAANNSKTDEASPFISAAGNADAGG